jgi:hypothetical protein
MSQTRLSLSNVAAIGWMERSSLQSVLLSLNKKFWTIDAGCGSIAGRLTPTGVAALLGTEGIKSYDLETDTDATCLVTGFGFDFVATCFDLTCFGLTGACSFCDRTCFGFICFFFACFFGFSLAC